MYLDIKEGKTEVLERYMHNMLDENHRIKKPAHDKNLPDARS